jgi:dCTP deaminase
MRQPLQPFCDRTVAFGLSYGVSVAGYDIRIAETVWLEPGGFSLASTVERFNMPLDYVGIVHDKSTWARLGLALQNTVAEPGWSGYLTIELSNHGKETLHIQAGSPIAQVIFHVLDVPADRGYTGKYQNQGQGPQPAKFE